MPQLKNGIYAKVGDTVECIRRENGPWGNATTGRPTRHSPQRGQWFKVRGITSLGGRKFLRFASYPGKWDARQFVVIPSDEKSNDQSTIQHLWTPKTGDSKPPSPATPPEKVRELEKIE